MLQVAAVGRSRAPSTRWRAPSCAEAEARSLAYLAGRGLPGPAGPRGGGHGSTGRTARVGNLALFAGRRHRRSPRKRPEELLELEQAGNTVMLVQGAPAPGHAPEMLGLVAVADTVRPEARAATAALEGRGHPPHGDADRRQRAHRGRDRRAGGRGRGARQPAARRQGAGDREAHGGVRPGGDGGRRRERRAGPGALHRRALRWAAPARTRRSRPRTSC